MTLLYGYCICHENSVESLLYVGLWCTLGIQI
jgi:hypothetical protein